MRRSIRLHLLILLFTIMKYFSEECCPRCNGLGKEEIHSFPLSFDDVPSLPGVNIVTCRICGGDKVIPTGQYAKRLEQSIENTRKAFRESPFRVAPIDFKEWDKKFKKKKKHINKRSPFLLVRIFEALNP